MTSLLLGLLLLAAPPRSVPARVVEVTGQVTAGGKKLEKGALVGAPSEIDATRGSVTLTWDFSDAPTLSLERVGGVHLFFAGEAGVRLGVGDVRATIASGQSLSISAPADSLRVMLTVSSESKGTVTLALCQTRVFLPPGSAVSFVPLAVEPAVTVQAEIGTPEIGLRAGAHRAMLAAEAVRDVCVPLPDQHKDPPEVSIPLTPYQP